MARLTLTKLRNNLKEQQSYGRFDGLWTPAGNIELGESVVLRFLPYEDALSKAFWTVQKMIKLTFVDPTNTENELYYYVPSLEMYVNPAEERCPVATLTRGLFSEARALSESGASKDAERVEKVAYSHWFNYAYYFQGFVISGGKPAPNPNELKAMKMVKTIYNTISTSLQDSTSGIDKIPTGTFDIDDINTLFEGKVPDDMTDEDFINLFVGRNFIARKTTKNNRNNYETCSWDLKESALTDEQVDYIHENGLLDMSTFLPKRPTAEMYDVFAEMAQESIDYAFGRSDGVWKPEWEECGIVRPKGPHKNGEPTASVKDRVRAIVSGTSDATTTDTIATRGANVDVAEEPDEAPVASGSANNKVDAMRARLKARKAKAAG